MRESTILNEAYWEYMRIEHPTMAEHAFGKAKITGSKNEERIIKDKIRRFCIWKGHWCTVVDSSAHFNKDLGFHVKSETSIGSPDLIASIKGRFVGVEVKRDYGKSKDRQSEQQKKVENRITNDDGKYIIVKDFMSFYEWYSNNIINK